MNAYDVTIMIVGALSWLVLIFGYAWTIWKLARPGRDAILGAPGRKAKILEFRVRQRRAPGNRPEDRLDRAG